MSNDLDIRVCPHRNPAEAAAAAQRIIDEIDREHGNEGFQRKAAVQLTPKSVQDEQWATAAPDSPLRLTADFLRKQRALISDTASESTRVDEPSEKQKRRMAARSG
jgi:hypothetical protein